MTFLLACPPWLHFANSLLHVWNKAGSTQRRPLMPQSRRSATSRSELRLQFKTRICLRKRTFNWTSGILRYGNAFVLNETIAQPLVIFNLYVKTVPTGNFLYENKSLTLLLHLKLPSLSFFSLCHIFCKPRNTNATFKGRESILFFCRWQRLVSTMKISVLLVFSFVLPLVGAQVPHWGPCPDPDVQPAFSLKEVQFLYECIGHSLPNYIGNDWKATTCTKN